MALCQSSLSGNRMSVPRPFYCRFVGVCGVLCNHLLHTLFCCSDSFFKVLFFFFLCVPIDKLTHPNPHSHAHLHPGLSLSVIVFSSFLSLFLSCLFLFHFPLFISHKSSSPLGPFTFLGLFFSLVLLSTLSCPLSLPFQPTFDHL